VDIHSNILISEIIAKLKALDKIILISSHIFSTLGDCSDEIRLLKDGIFYKTVSKKDFSELENEMKNFIVGNKIDKLKIR
jgi:ABC-2 type transport system ATP-binding protein